MRHTSLSFRNLHHPRHSTCQVHRCRSDDVCKVRLGQTNVTRAAQSERARTLRDRALSARSRLVVLLELRRLLTLASGLQRLVLGLGLESQHSSARLGAGTTTSRFAARTVFGAETDLNDRQALFCSVVPTVTHFALGTAYLLCFPIDGKAGDVKGRFIFGLPTGFWQRGTTSSEKARVRPYFQKMPHDSQPPRWSTQNSRCWLPMRSLIIILLF